MKRLIKYAALLFALVLSASIIGGCLLAGVSLVRVIVDKTENSDGEGIWYGIENGDLVFRWGNVNISESSGEVKSGSEQFSAADITTLDINVGSVSFVVEPWDNDYFFVEYENIPVEYQFYLKDGALVIDREDNISFIWNVSYSETPKIHVSVPSSHVFEKVKVDKGSGSAQLIGLVTDDISVDNGSGGLGISNVTTKNLYLDSGSGGVNISDSTSEKSILRSGSGSFIVRNCTLGIASMDAGSGSVTFEDIVAKDLVVDAGSGRVDVSGILTGNCEFESGSGSMNVVVYGNEEDYNYRVDMGSGNFYLNDRKEDNDFKKNDKRAKYMLKFDAGSGRVSLEFKDAPDSIADNLQNEAANGSGENFDR